MDTTLQNTSETDTALLGGLTIVAFESRMAAETAAMIERLGGRPIVAPSMREVPLEDNAAAFEFARALLAGEIDVAILLTGVGTRALFKAMELRHPRAALIAALGRACIVARGPKPVHALRELELIPTIAVGEPNTWRELLAALAARIDLRGKRVAVQEYGASNRELIAGLEARGALVMIVPVYRWTMPHDCGPLRAALKTIAARGADVAMFTSQNQVINVMQMAEAEGIEPEFRRALAAMVVASVGPVCSEALRARGVGVDLEPAHPRLGHLIKEIANRGRAILDAKRVSGKIQVTLEADQARPTRPRTPAPAHSAIFRDHPLIRACHREPVPYTPIWLMRQAGRYMPEFMRVRARHSFLELCQTPALAAEVTVTAAQRLGVDAAIIFADILLPLVPMEVGLHYETGDGPMIDRPVRTAQQLEQIPSFDVVERLGFVAEAIKIARVALAGKTPIIGFAGAPFTLASYLIEGGGSRQYRATKTLMYREPETWHRLMELLARITGEYLNMQIQAGADVVQLFDSWVGSLGPDDYRRFVLPHTAAAIAAIPADMPLIHFGTITGNLLDLMREAGGDVIGLDWRVNLAEAWTRLGAGVGVQGNLDPIALFADVAEIRTRARAILDQAGGRPGHIFNLGHGILPETPIDHVIALVDAVHEMSARRL
jgi:uroporphyrinogen decarboxylase